MTFREWLKVNEAGWNQNLGGDYPGGFDVGDDEDDVKKPIPLAGRGSVRNPLRMGSLDQIPDPNSEDDTAPEEESPWDFDLAKSYKAYHRSSDIDQDNPPSTAGGTSLDDYLAAKYGNDMSQDTSTSDMSDDLDLAKRPTKSDVPTGLHALPRGKATRNDLRDIRRISSTGHQIPRRSWKRYRDRQWAS